MSSKYVDIPSLIQVIGNVYLNPSLLDLEDKYYITEDDFPDAFHKTVFGAIYKIHELGSDKVSLNTISDFLSSRPKSLAIYTKDKGEEWLTKAIEVSEPLSFDYYYNRMKKMTLLRAYENCGVDVSDIYDPDNILDSKKKQIQEEWLDNASIADIVKKIDEKIDAIKSSFGQEDYNDFEQIGSGVFELIDRYKETPEVGIPLYGPLINTVTRGARLKKFYLRSAGSGYGKTRALLADACNFACNRIYDETFGWINNGQNEPTLFIATEQDLGEIQTMALAFLSYVNEEHILNGTYENDEEDRVREAAKILQNSPLYLEVIPDFSLLDIENIIKKSIRDYDVKYVCFDYIHSSMKILEEITRRSGGVRLREDNILFMLSTKIKEICNVYEIFVESATQLSGDWRDSDTPDQSLLRGKLLRCALIYLIR